jgi:MoaA/NifB/PqqE/SkfB family radical SAM enzyme
MPDINLTQAEAIIFFKMEKHCVNDEKHYFPMRSSNLILPLQSPDKRESFLLDISRGRIDLLRCKYQNRVQQVVILARLDLGGSPHRNPDGEEIPCPHIHLYREGYGDKWAEPLPIDYFSNTEDLWTTLEEFFKYCNITKPPVIEKGLFL